MNKRNERLVVHLRKRFILDKVETLDLVTDEELLVCSEGTLARVAAGLDLLWEDVRIGLGEVAVYFCLKCKRRN